MPPNTRPSVSSLSAPPKVSTQPFEFSPVPGILPPHHSSSIPLMQPNIEVSQTPISSSIAPPDALLSSNLTPFLNKNNVSLSGATQGRSDPYSFLSTPSPSNSTPNTSRCATPNSSSIDRCVTPPDMFMVQGLGRWVSRLCVSNTVKRKSKSTMLVPEIIRTIEGMPSDAFNGTAIIEPCTVTTGVETQSKYNQLLAVIHDIEKDIRPSYAGSKSSLERLKKGISHARVLIREALYEIERSSSGNDSEEVPIEGKYPKLQ